MRGRERGAAGVEYVGALAVVSVIVAALVVAVQVAPAGSVVDSAICTVRQLAPCSSATGTDTVQAADPSVGPGADPSGDTGDRRDQEGQTRDDRRGRGSDKSPEDPQVAGPDAGDDALGTAVPGSSVAEPDPPAWKPGDEGAGEYDSARAWPWDHAKKVAIEAAANLQGSGRTPLATCHTTSPTPASRWSRT